jgi:hypothetical protein
MNNLIPLNPHDLRWCLRRMPKEVQNVLKANARRSCVAGGFIRSCIAGETINDVDIFAADLATAKAMAFDLSTAGRPEGRPRKVHESANAFTIKDYFITPQIIHRWTFPDVMDVAASFDFTIACSLIFWSGSEWQGLCDPTFYPDLAAKRLVYRSPQRNEDAGGSMLRVLKFYARGYRIPLESLGAVMARMAVTLDENKLRGLTTDFDGSREKAIARVLTGLLVEVDPVIDPSHEAHLPGASEDEATN